MHNAIELRWSNGQAEGQINRLQREMSQSARIAFEGIQTTLDKGYISKPELERRRQARLSQQYQEKLKKQEQEMAKA